MKTNSTDYYINMAECLLNDENSKKTSLNEYFVPFEEAYIKALQGTATNMHLACIYSTIANLVRFSVYSNSVICIEKYFSEKAYKFIANDKKWIGIYNKRDSLALCKRILK